MNSNPSACEDRHDAAPYDVRNRSTGAKILDDWDGKRLDFVQEVESINMITAAARVFLYLCATNVKTACPLTNIYMKTRLNGPRRGVKMVSSAVIRCQ
jgi:hypothetical protein